MRIVIFPYLRKQLSVNRKGTKRGMKKIPFLGLAAGLFIKSSKFLKILKGLKAAKVFLAVFSMALSMALYSWTYGLIIGVGLIVLLFIHEMGHVIAIKMRGLAINALVFIPGLGAGIFMPPTKRPDDEAFVAIGGPLVGGLSALLLYGAWLLNGSYNAILFILAYIGILINLFNLIPVRPLDGGRIMGVVSPWFKYVGLGAIVLFAINMKEAGLLLILILSLSDFSWTKRVQYLMSLGVTGAMIAAFMLGFTNQPFWISAVDVSLAIFCTLCLFYSWIDDQKKLDVLLALREEGKRLTYLFVDSEESIRHEHQKKIVHVEERIREFQESLIEKPKLLHSEGERVGWTLKYIGLGLCLGLVFVHQISHMDVLTPHIVDTRSYK